MIEVTEEELVLADAVDSVRTPHGGAIVAFIGTVRREGDMDGLEFEAYQEMATERMEAIRQEAIQRFGVLDATVVHRVGRVGIGEDIVIIAVSAAHRVEAFEACRYLIDEMKVTVPIWKREVGTGTWVEGAPMREVGGDRTQGMVDVSGKDIVHRQATARGFIELSLTSLDAIRSRSVRKGDVLEVARVAALWGIKHTPSVIPHCHPIPLTAASVEFDVGGTGVTVTCRVKADYRTGVEMEALTGASSALLTIWDMVKYLEKDGEGQYPVTRIRELRVLEKTVAPTGGDPGGS
jgi:cyclic pyranopterin phosphate synthase